MNDTLKPEDHAEIQRRYAPAVDDEDVEERRRNEIEDKRRQAEVYFKRCVSSNKALDGVVRHIAFNAHNEMNYGFITPDDSLLDDLFVHHSEIEPWRDGFKELKKGDRVRFKIAPGKNGKYQAVNVEVLRSQPQGATRV